MNRIEKFLKKLSKKERNEILNLVSLVIALNLDGLDIKKLRESDDRYRLRKGKIRIVFKKEKGKGIIINIDYRKNIYK